MRVLDIEGGINFRDFGGWRGAGGRRVRTGLLFRSGSLAHLTEHGVAQAGRLGIRLICDLRRDDERASEPSRLPSNRPAVEEIAIDPGNAIAMRAALESGELGLEERIRFMVEINRDLARDHTEDYRRMFRRLLDTEGSFLVHCAAGKDRTGFGVALVQLALGVPHEEVTRDYLLTNEALDWETHVLPRVRARVGPHVPVDMEATMALAGVRPEYLAAAFAEIDARFESVERYLGEAIGLTPADFSDLQARLLTPG